MTSSEAKRRLLWHGILIFGLGLVIGALTPVLTNPRMGVAAHLGGVLSGMFLVIVGLIWEELRLAPRLEKVTLWLFLYSSYAGWMAQFLAALFGTSGATPIAGAGYRGSAWQEALVYFVAGSFSVAISVACITALWGLRKAKTG